jgi:hypothetical protein
MKKIMGKNKILFKIQMGLILIKIIINLNNIFIKENINLIRVMGSKENNNTDFRIIS